MNDLGAKSKRLYQFNLDSDAEEVLKKIPKMERSRFVRDLIKKSVIVEKIKPVVRIKA